MSISNPYQQWLQIPSDGTRPDHYLLLGLPLFEKNAEAISAAVETQIAKVGTFVAGNPKLAQRLLREIDQARTCLMDPAAREAYDARLQLALGGTPLEITEITDASAPVARTADPAQAARPASPADLLADALPPGATSPLAVPVAQAVPAARRATPRPQPAQAAQPVVDDNDDEDTPVAGLAEDLLPPGAAPVTLPPAAQAPVAAAAPVALPAQTTAAPTTARIAPQAAAQASFHVQPAAPRKNSRGKSGPSPLVVLGAAGALLLVIGGVSMYALGWGPFAREEEEEQVAQNGDTPTTANGAPADGNSAAAAPNPADNKTPANTPHNTPNNQPPQNNNPPADGRSGNPGVNNATTVDPPERMDPPATPNNPPPTNSPDVAASVTATLEEARTALGARQFDVAKAKVAAARELNPVGELATAVMETEMLSQYVDTFWQTVRQSVSTLKPADAVELGNVTVNIIETDDRGLRLRKNGQNERHDYDTMPPELAYALAERMLPDSRQERNLILGAFLIVDPKANHQHAAELLSAAAGTNAQHAGALRNQLTLAMAAAPGTNGNPTPNGETPGTLSDGMPESAGPTFGAKVAPPEQAALDTALAELKTKHAEELAAAQDAAAHLALAETLRDAARAEGDATVRFALLQLATGEAEAAGVIQTVLELTEIAGDSFEMDVLAAKLERLNTASRWKVELRGQVPQAALDLADDAVLLERYPEAIRAARMAQTAARGLGDAELLKETGARVIALTAVSRAENGR